MPIYEYGCGACGGRFEAMQKFSDEPLGVCRLCGAEGVKKVLSLPAFVLKGEGWYVTDYPSDARKKGLQSESPSPAKPAEPAAPACAAGGCSGGSCPSKG